MERISPGFAGKDPIIAVVSRNIDAALSGFGFELAFTGERVGSSERYLVVDLDESRSRVEEDSTANVLGRGGLAPVSIRKAAAYGGFVLVHMDAIARMELFFGESVLVTGTRFLLLGLVRTAFGFCGLTG